MKTYRVQAKLLNVRKEPSFHCEVIMVLRQGSICHIIEEKDGWGYLRSTAGWICLRYVKKTEPQELQELQEPQKAYAPN